MIKKIVVMMVALGGVVVADHQGWLRPVKLGVEVVGLPVSQVLVRLRAPVDQAWQGLRFVRSGMSRIADLEREVAWLRLVQQEVVRLRQENAALRQRLELDLPVEPVARVVGQVVSWESDNNEVIVAVGRIDGAKQGMVGTTAQGVGVGKVVAVGEKSARVRLITHQDSRVGVVVGKGEAVGVVEGTGGGLILTQVKQGEIIEEGAVVVSSGKDWPVGLGMGTVGKILATGAAVYQQAEVKPMVEYQTVKLLFLVEAEEVL